MEKKRILLSLASAGVLATTAAVVVSCGCSSTVSDPLAGVTDSKIETLKTTYGTKIKTEADKIGNETQIEEKLRSVLITAGGIVTDKSFNQSAYLGIRGFYESVGITQPPSYIETLNDAELAPQYEVAVNSGNKIIILTGFQQKAALLAWLQGSGKNFIQKIKDQGIVFIGVDWTLTNEELTAAGIDMPGRIIGLNFDVQEGAWIAGSAVAEYLSTLTTEQLAGATRNLNAFGGGDFAGVTNFASGFLQGIIDFNKTANVTKVGFGTGTTSSITLNTGFDVALADKRAEVNRLVDQKAKIMLPIAGSFTEYTAAQIRQSGLSQLLIGVDSDQSQTLSQFKEMFVTSIEKNIGVAIFKAITFTQFSTVLSPTDNALFNGFVLGTTSKTVNGGIADGFVGLAKSTLAQGAADIDALITKYTAAFNATPPTIPVMTAGNQTVLNGLVGTINARPAN